MLHRNGRLSATENKLKVTYSAGGTLNVGTGSVTEVAGEITHTFTSTGQVSANEILATDYILAPKDEDKVLNLTIQLNTETRSPLPTYPSGNVSPPTSRVNIQHSAGLLSPLRLMMAGTGRMK